MSNYYIVYHSLLLLCLALSFVAFLRGRKRFLILSAVFTATLIVEIGAEILIRRRINFTFIYHLFNPVEFALFALYLMQCIRLKKLRKIICFAIPLYFIVSIGISIAFYSMNGFPGININLEGLLLSLLSAWMLFNLEITEDIPVYLVAEFWICSALLIFFGCTFLVNGVYTNLLHMETVKAKQLFSLLNKPLNIVMYVLIIIGVTCSILKKRYSSIRF